MTAAACWLSKRKLHLQHGPIDLIIEAEGPDAAIAFASAQKRFATVLDELVSELPLLRCDTALSRNQLSGSIARRMADSASRFAGKYTTPMIAVAGSVADEVLAAMCHNTVLDKAYVNNGGDIALYLSDAQCFKAAIVSNPQTADIAATVNISASDQIKGIATSGRHGRSLSLGIADAVTVMAASASRADTAATLIANEVNLRGCAAIQSVPATEIDPDSDLGDQLVTVDVGELAPDEISCALDSGLRYAQWLCDRKLINAAYLTLRGECRTVSSIVMPETGRLMYA